MPYLAEPRPAKSRPAVFMIHPVGHIRRVHLSLCLCNQSDHLGCRYSKAYLAIPIPGNPEQSLPDTGIPCLSGPVPI